MRLSVVIPAKNEATVIGNLVCRIAALSSVDEIVVVDDGSADGTAQQAAAAGARVISHPYSQGNGAAIKSGARTAKGEIIVFMDGDGQHNPDDIPRLLARLDEGYDMVVGARQKGSQASVWRGLANRFYNRLASYMTGHKVEDLTSGFRAARADKFREFLSLLPNGFSYPTTCTMAFFRSGYAVAYEPIDAARRIGKSHIQLVRDGLRFLLIIFKIGTLYSPLKLFTPIAGSFLGVGLLYYAYTYLEYGRFTNMSALLLTTAVIVFLIGLVSEQIAQLMYAKADK
ncbi:glycosyl transferase [Betaproteobacteria bacterium]|nr:glycosyl transferase [Betaproteobacteria bacterium]GHU00818.1 glycosyl transferase [Betaproteobacteria bacterium]GHU15849.1 glycosyl transferase [Betaproteobacteria bacterium]